MLFEKIQKNLIGEKFSEISKKLNEENYDNPINFLRKILIGISTIIYAPFYFSLKLTKEYFSCKEEGSEFSFNYSRNKIIEVNPTLQEKVIPVYGPINYFKRIYKIQNNKNENEKIKIPPSGFMIIYFQIPIFESIAIITYLLLK